MKYSVLCRFVDLCPFGKVTTLPQTDLRRKKHTHILYAVCLNMSQCKTHLGHILLNKLGDSLIKPIMFNNSVSSWFCCVSVMLWFIASNIIINTVFYLQHMMRSYSNSSGKYLFQSCSEVKRKVEVNVCQSYHSYFMNLSSRHQRGTANTPWKSKCYANR